jgi:hypothetical protein
VASVLGITETLWLGAGWLLLTVAIVLSFPSVRGLPNERVEPGAWVAPVRR